MEHKLIITLPDEVYQPLVEAALEEGRTPEELAAERLSRTLPTPPPQPPNGEKKASIRDFFGSVSLGHPTGADNESIDRDLAREYAATHEETD
ncbi:MAG: hypothetical protein ACJ74J_22920 [Blastocatellia bacterium]